MTVSQKVSETIGSVLLEARRALAGVSDDASLEVRLLAQWAFELSALELVTKAEMLVDAAGLQRFRAAMVRRVAGEPVHRIMGYREFYGLRLALSRGTLEPRPDTETLVELVLDHIRAPWRRGEALEMLDLGTGTGALALAFLSVLPEARAMVTDISSDALATAVANARSLGFDGRLTAVEGSWLEPVKGQFDIIVSNPPYIRSALVATLDVEVREHDPLEALDGGEDGLEPYRIIAAGAARHLRPDGLVAVEIGYDQASDVSDIFEAYGFALTELRKDLGGRDRALAFALR